LKIDKIVGFITVY